MKKKTDASGSDEDVLGTAQDASSDMETWVKARTRRIKKALAKDGKGQGEAPAEWDNLVRGYREGDWIAIRALLEEFPEAEDRAEESRRQIVVQRYEGHRQTVLRWGQECAPWTFCVKLDALREDRAKNPHLYPERTDDVSQRPWRQGLRAQSTWELLREGAQNYLGAR